MTILLRGIVGSTAYGLAGPASDVDRLGVFAAPTEDFHGLHPPVGKAATVVRSKPDLTLHEVGKFASLALAGNPTVSELMWLPDELYEVRTGLGDELIAIRTAFLSAPRVRDAYFGYATSQLHRLLRAGPVPSETRQRSAKHGRHLLRLLDQGFALYSTGQLPIRLADPERYLEFGARVADDPEAARPVLAAAQARFDSVRSPLPGQPDEATVERWLLRVRRAELREPCDIMPR
ncbi:nucleotidyltransferase domain-containing protein [Rugosimonospora africana]|uniref:Nucleotidyltransferase n=1 Tax=Rugosimonospora africana TaxID=556532 RepID=A0A8J3VQG6_9ACTN|nr:nucleotidyltransferase domain-containing protein [Rugosimonospora africana]GIH14456.1 nucleotidyltransferase [Rugosimonospora africana]